MEAKVDSLSPRHTTLPTARAEDVGLSSSRLDRIATHLKRRYLEPSKVAGTVTLVARRGQVAYLEPLGFADLATKQPMREDTICRIYSMTKPIASVALMSLYEQGVFQLDDPVGKFIPEWRSLRVYKTGNYPTFFSEPCGRAMTVRDLLTHMSGLSYGFMERTNVDAAYRRLGIGDRQGGDLRQMVEALSTLPLDFSPGTAWGYSVATDIVGYLVELFSGQRLDRYLRETIFEPLGMVDTAFSVPSDKADRLATCYERAPDKSLRVQDGAAESAYLEEPKLFSGGSGLVSTAADYFRFCQMLLDGGELAGERILGRKTIELMTMNHLPGGRDLAALSVGAFSETTYEGNGFGLGFAVVDSLRDAQSIGSVGEYYWGGRASTIFWIDPKESLIVVFLVQFLPSGTFNFRGQLKSIVYSSIVD